MLAALRNFWCATGGGARWALFWGSVSLVLLVPAIFLPAMLVANAVDGATYYSIWSSIGMLRERGSGFLAAVIFTFSIVFPLLKLVLLLLAASVGPRFPEIARRRIVAFTEWTSKYSMLDVYVMALLVLQVKVDQYIKMLPSLGLYLFCAAVFTGALASGALKRADPLVPMPRRPWYRNFALVSAVSGLGLSVGGYALLKNNLQGYVNQISLKNLTNRPMPRTFERVLGLKELMKPEHELFSRETLGLLVDALQAATTDSGMQKQLGYLRVETNDGQEHLSAAQAIDPQAAPTDLTFQLPSMLPLAHIRAIEFKTKVEFTSLLPAELTEERIEAASDWSRPWHRDWYGRLFEYHLHGPEPSSKRPGAWMLGLGLVVLLWGLSGLWPRSVARI